VQMKPRMRGSMIISPSLSMLAGHTRIARRDGLADTTRA